MVYKLCININQWSIQWIQFWLIESETMKANLELREGKAERNIKTVRMYCNRLHYKEYVFLSNLFISLEFKLYCNEKSLGLSDRCLEPNRVEKYWELCGCNARAVFELVKFNDMCMYWVLEKSLPAVIIMWTGFKRENN